MFSYCENNPVIGSDPTGEMVWWAAAALGGAAFEVASYLIGNAISGNKSTWNGVGKAALAGAITGLAFGAVGKGVQAVSKAAKAAKAAKYTSGTSNEIGKIGEQLSGITKNTTKYNINGRVRIPDGVTADYIQEVKNVKKLSYTSQLRDYVQLANDTGRKLELFVRPNTEFTKPLRKAIADNSIRITNLW